MDKGINQTIGECRCGCGELIAMYETICWIQQDGAYKLGHEKRALKRLERTNA